MSDAKPALPHWDLSNVYSGLEADDFAADLKQAGLQLDELDAFARKAGIERLAELPTDVPATAKTLEEMIGRLNRGIELLETLGAYVYSFVTTDSYNKVASRRQSEIEQLEVRLRQQMTRFQAFVGSLGPILDDLAQQSDVIAEHRLALDDEVEQSRYLMETPLEDLASELLLTGGGSMWKLQGVVTSQLKMPFEREGKIEDLPMTVIRSLASDPDPDIRRRAHEVELEGWASIREPVAFALNCVKGSSITLARRRGFEGVLHAALERNRIDRQTLDALLGSIRDHFPMFRRYFASKAEKLGKKRLDWWDLAAPVGTSNPTYSWAEARAYVEGQFAQFSDELAAFARRAFENDWIDAEPRDGKRGGAFCMSVPKVKESRVLANFDGSFDQLVTIAHELGHGYHNYCQRDLPPIRSGSPMCLAETASIFCETLVFNAALQTASPAEQLSILENQLLGASQVTVDISSRFIFESEVIDRRAEVELSADDFCEIMLRAQKETYGDALDAEHLHPYMWLLKPHYYYGNLNFYNFPYAFGLLFGLGVFAVYEREGKAFIPRYQELLRSTGAGKAADLAERFGIDIRSRDFWNGSLSVIAGQVDRYCALQE